MRQEKVSCASSPLTCVLDSMPGGCFGFGLDWIGILLGDKWDVSVAIAFRQHGLPRQDTGRSNWRGRTTIRRMM